MSDPFHAAVPPDDGPELPRVVPPPLGDAEDGIEPVPAGTDDAWGQDDALLPPLEDDPSVDHQPEPEEPLP